MRLTRRLKIVVADDEWLEVETLCHLLRDDTRTAVVGTATDGLTAVKMVQQVQPDLVLMDIRMPGMDGLEATRLIREELPQTQVVIVTAFGEFEYARQALSRGAASYLLKPVKVEELQDAVGRVQQIQARQAAERLNLEGDVVRNLIQGRFSLQPAQEDELAEAVRQGESVRAAAICRSLLPPAAAQDRPLLLALLAELLAVLVRTARGAGADTRRVGELHTAWADRIAAVADRAQGLHCAGEMATAFTGVVTAGWTSGPKRLVARAQAYVDSHYAAEISLESVAAHLGIHPAYLSRLFSRETGQSFVEYLSVRRLTVAKDLLSNLELTIDQVAARVGFRSASYFSTVFRRRFGQSPGEFRRQRG